MDIEQRLLDLEARVYQTESTRNNGFPNADVLPSDLKAEVTAGIDGAVVVLTWANWQHMVKGYEVWVTRPDGSVELGKTVQYPPAFLTVKSVSAAPFTFRVRPIMETGEEVSLDFSPGVAATIPPPAIGSGDIADGAIQDQHFDRVTANRIVVVDADILTLTANKLTAGTINAAVISVINITASNINAGTLNAAVVNVTNINASNINAGTLTAINISGGTYTLTSSPNTMTITGATGFRQLNTTNNTEVRIIDGTVAGYSSSSFAWDTLIQVSGANSSGFFRVFRNNNLRGVFGADTIANAGFLHLYDPTGDIEVELNGDPVSPFHGVNIGPNRVVGPRQAAVHRRAPGGAPRSGRVTKKPVKSAA